MECGKVIYKFSDMWCRAKFRLLGHLLRIKDEHDPIKQVVFEPNSYRPRRPPKRRAGKLREVWIVETMEEAFDEIINDRLIHFDPENEDQIALLKPYAEKREHIFETKTKHAPTQVFCK